VITKVQKDKYCGLRYLSILRQTVITQALTFKKYEYNEVYPVVFDH